MRGGKEVEEVEIVHGIVQKGNCGLGIVYIWMGEVTVA